MGFYNRLRSGTPATERAQYTTMRAYTVIGIVQVQIDGLWREIPVCSREWAPGPEEAKQNALRTYPGGRWHTAGLVQVEYDQ